MKRTRHHNNNTHHQKHTKHRVGPLQDKIKPVGFCSLVSFHIYRRHTYRVPFELQILTNITLNPLEMIYWSIISISSTVQLHS